MPRHPPNALLILESNHPCAGTSPAHGHSTLLADKHCQRFRSAGNRRQIRNIGNFQQPSHDEAPCKDSAQNRWKPKTYSQCQTAHAPNRSRVRKLNFLERLSPSTKQKWWSRSGSNRRPVACKATALPTELRPRYVWRPSHHIRAMVGLGRFELPTSRLSGVRSNQLSYRPNCADPQFQTQASIGTGLSNQKGYVDGGSAIKTWSFER